MFMLLRAEDETARRRERQADGYVSSTASDKKRNNKKAWAFLSRKQGVPRFSTVLNPFPLSVSRHFDPLQKNSPSANISRSNPVK